MVIMKRSRYNALGQHMSGMYDAPEGAASSAAITAQKGVSHQGRSEGLQDSGQIETCKRLCAALPFFLSQESGT